MLLTVLNLIAAESTVLKKMNKSSLPLDTQLNHFCCTIRDNSSASSAKRQHRCSIRERSWADVGRTIAAFVGRPTAALGCRRERHRWRLGSRRRSTGSPGYQKAESTPRSRALASPCWPHWPQKKKAKTKIASDKFINLINPQSEIKVRSSLPG